MAYIGRTGVHSGINTNASSVDTANVPTSTHGAAPVGLSREESTTYTNVPPPTPTQPYVQPPSARQPVGPPINPFVMLVTDIANALHHAPEVLDLSYYDSCRRASEYLTKDKLKTSLKPESPIATELGLETVGSYFSRKSEAEDRLRQAISEARNNVFDTVNMTSAFSVRAKNLGFSPPDNPFSEIASLNVGRESVKHSLRIDDVYAADIITNIDAYIKLMQAERNGLYDLTKVRGYSAQMMSTRISLNGFGGTGDTLRDLLSMMPDMDAIKARKAQDSLAILDFSKRIPRIVFTASYDTSDGKKRCVVGWKRIADASGYILKRREVFSEEEKQTVITNAAALSAYDSVRDYVKTHVLSFYDDIGEDSIYAYVDELAADSYYVYKIQAYRTKRSIYGSTLFMIESSPCQQFQVNSLISKLNQNRDRNNGFFSMDVTDVNVLSSIYSSLSPYPMISQLCFSNPSKDWIIAGLNTRESIKRGASLDETRKYSYVSAQWSFLLSQASEQKLLIPTQGGMGQFEKNIEDAISEYGVTQVIQDIMQETGILYFFEGKDAKQDVHFDAIGKDDATTSPIIDSVVRSIDPETMMMNVSVLATNMLGMMLKTNVETLDKSKLLNESKPSEIEVVEQSSIEKSVNDEVQFMSVLGKLDGNYVDLTTFEGISIFMRILRILSDVGPDRGSPVESSIEQSLPDAVYGVDAQSLPSVDVTGLVESVQPSISSINVLQQNAENAADRVTNTINSVVNTLVQPIARASNDMETQSTAQQPTQPAAPSTPFGEGASITRSVNSVVSNILSMFKK